MDNLPPELQARLIQLQFSLQKRHFLSSALALEKLTHLLSTHYQLINQADQKLQQLHSSPAKK